MTVEPFEVTATVLSDWLNALGTCSAPGPGVTRLVYDPAWCQAHRWLTGKARDLGLAVHVDAAGNLYFHDPEVAPDPKRPVVLVGSHLDTVIHGGLYDGAYGLIAAMLLAAEPRSRDALPVVAFATCEEEESRFHGGLLGARSMLGQVDSLELDSVVDAAGITWRQALAQARLRGCAGPLPDGPRPFGPVFRPAAMLELHIEQGPVLENELLSLGIVESIAGYRHYRVRLLGEARHSGTTPMRMRRDALSAAAEIVLASESYAKDLGGPAVATVGHVAVTPGQYNVIPGTCELWLEIRHVDRATLASMELEFGQRCRAIADARGVNIEIQEVSRQEPAGLDRGLIQMADALASEKGIPHRRMASGAAHDTMVFARASIPSLLVFVPSRYGVSHSADEFTAPEDLATGYRFVSELVTRVARTPR